MEDLRPYRTDGEEPQDDDRRLEWELRRDRDREAEDDVPFYIPRD